MAMPAFVYRSFFGGYGVKSFERSTLALCGIGPISETLLGGAGAGCERRSGKWLDLMKRLAEEDSSPQVARRRRFVKALRNAAVLLAGSYAAYVLAASRGKAWWHAPSDGNGAAREINVAELEMRASANV
jgi:hypothetical protein